MKHTATKLFWALCGVAVMLAFAAGITSIPATAASNGIYIATATPHYKHPATGLIEDSGGEGSSVLGQSMTESATYKQALVEVDASGNTYVTIRLQLMDNIQNPKFQVDGKRNGSFSAVSASLMQEDYTNNTADYRMKVPNENAVIRCNMYVTAMGREVIFYITVANLQSGSGDFITSVKVEQPKTTQTAAKTETPATKAPVQTPAATTPAATTKTPATQPTAVQAPTEEPQTTTTQTPAESEPEEPTAGEAVEPSGAETDTAKEDGGVSGTENTTSKDSKVSGLQEFDASGDKVDGSTENHSDSQTKSDGSAAGWMLGAIALAVIAGGCVWYFCIFKKKK